ncbi:MAG: SpoIIE family protein phosphatase [Planctomycetota bacterium]|nr:SpoIIE family protein phosphatase [Planctomycetota bacterium]MDP6990695.1 SpoIIE family protein phosphatase [Planctomycetota bacterium]
MFFRKKKGGGDAPSPAGGAAEVPAQARPGADGDEASISTEFLTGDALADRRSVEGLLDEVARISEMVARVGGPDDLRDLLTYIVDASIERTGASRGLLVLTSPEAGEGAEGHEVHVARSRDGADLGDDVRYSTSAVGRVLESGVALKDVFNSAAEAMDLGASVFDLKLRALMCVPLDTERGGDSGRSGPRGALYVDSKAATREFTQQDLSYFNALAQQIAVALESARLHLDSLERARLEASLDTAELVQKNLMPQVPADLPGYDLFGWFRAAERTSGDFYDFFRTKGGRQGVVVGDVTGHGPASALITSTAQASLRSTMRIIDDPCQALTMLNEDLAERMDSGLFVTLFLALLSDDGAVEVVNAGHTPPLVYRAADGSIESIEGHGPALGMMPDFRFEEGSTLTLGEGDVLLAVTDGLVEARSLQAPDDLFGEEGLRRVLGGQARAAAGARELTEAIVAEALDFSGGNTEDDMTVVSVRRLAT